MGTHTDCNIAAACSEVSPGLTLGSLLNRQQLPNGKWLKLRISKKLSVATAHEDENLMAQNIIYHGQPKWSIIIVINYYSILNNNIIIDTKYCTQHNNDQNGHE